MSETDLMRKPQFSYANCKLLRNLLSRKNQSSVVTIKNQIEILNKLVLESRLMYRGVIAYKINSYSSKPMEDEQVQCLIVSSIFKFYCTAKFQSNIFQAFCGCDN